MEKGVPPHPFPCLFCGVSGSPGNQEPEVSPPRVPINCEDKITFLRNNRYLEAIALARYAGHQALFPIIYFPFLRFTFLPEISQPWVDGLHDDSLAFSLLRFRTESSVEHVKQE